MLSKNPLPRLYPTDVWVETSSEIINIWLRHFHFEGMVNILISCRFLFFDPLEGEDIMDETFVSVATMTCGALNTGIDLSF